MQKMTEIQIITARQMIQNAFVLGYVTAMTKHRMDPDKGDTLKNELIEATYHMKPVNRSAQIVADAMHEMNPPASIWAQTTATLADIMEK